jgi:hypothetical protein
MDFSKTLIRASSMGVLFMEPKDAAAKKAGELSGTAKTYLIKTYIREYWKREKDFTNKQMQKGILGEDSLITLLSRVDKKIYSKNEVRESNEWATGHADIVVEDEIIDGKASWDAETFLPKLIEPVDKLYNIQLQTYMWLYDKPKARLSYGLVNTPDMIVQNELKRLLYSMDVISEESFEYKQAAEELMRNMIFDDIPISERVISIEVPRDEEIISQMPYKVEKARQFLQYFHEKHTKKAASYLITV